MSDHSNKEKLLVKNRVLFLSYNGLLEPILSSQAIPYLKELAKKNFEFVLVTYEKKKDLQNAGKDKINMIKDELRPLGIEWRYLRYHKNPKIFSTLFDMLVGTLYCLYLIPAKRIKLVHLRGITPGSIMIFLSKVLKVKILFDMRGLLAEEMAAGGLWEEGGVQFKLVKTAEKSLLKIADAVTVLTKKHLQLNKDLDYLKNRDIPMDVVPCCVDIDKFNYDVNSDLSFKKKLGMEGSFILMYQGKIGTFYLMDHMLDIYKNMLEIMPNAIFFILTTDCTDPVSKAAILKGIKEDSIRVAKNIEFELMPKYLAIADAGIFFINPYKKIGSSPIKMGEFLACGVPVIINPGVGDTEEIVLNNKVGVIVRQFDEMNYRSSIKELILLKQDGEALRKRCRDTAAGYLSLEEGVKRYSDIYETLTQEKL